MTELVMRRADDVWQFLRGIGFVWALVMAIPLVLLTLAPSTAPDVLGTSIAAFVGTLPYMAIAIGLIGGMRATGADSVIGAAFKGRETRMIVLAAMVGGLAPFCSCEVIPFISALLVAGVPLSAIMAFWLSSPLMDPPTFAITTGALGLDFALGKTVAAVGMGLAGGFIMQIAIRAGAFAEPLKAGSKVGGCCGTGPGLATRRPVWRFWNDPERVRTFAKAMGEQALFLGKWLSLAYLLEGMLVHYVPAEHIGALVGGSGVWPVVMGALVGAPAYLNGYAAPALIAGLVEQGMSAGAAMSFMVAGAVSCIPAMAAVFALVRLPIFMAYLGFGIGGAITSGLIFAAVIG